MALTINIPPAPIQVPVLDKTLMGSSWRNWFDRLFKNLSVTTPQVSSDRGDVSITIQIGRDAMTQIVNTPLTADRTVTLSTINVFNGAKFRITRTAAATGGSALNIGTGPLKALAAGQWADVEYDGSMWFLSATGSL